MEDTTITTSRRYHITSIIGNLAYDCNYHLNRYFLPLD
jgi:hypothetical protein